MPSGYKTLAQPTPRQAVETPPMLRLFAHSPDSEIASLWRQVAGRVRGVNILTGDHLACCLDGTVECDAVAMARSAMPARTDVERLLASGKHVLLVDHPGWPADEMESPLCFA